MIGSLIMGAIIGWMGCKIMGLRGSLLKNIMLIVKINKEIDASSLVSFRLLVKFHL